MKEGQSVKSLAKKYGVGTQTLYDLKKNELVSKFCAKSFSVAGMKKPKVLKKAENPKVDEATYEWSRQQRFKGTSISGLMIIDKAKEFHHKLQIQSDCSYFNGWLRKFKARHGIRSLKITGEKLSADYVSATCFVDDLQTLIGKEKLSLEQIYNVDETGLFWKLLPKTTLAHDECSVGGIKEPKERITVSVCSNTAGTHKCKLLVIGKSARPRAFKGLTELPVIYKSNKRAWVTQALFLDWFNNNFLAEVRQHYEDLGLDKNSIILLLLDNCPAHPDESTFQQDNIIVKYLPPNCTSLIQPMDQGIIRSLKCSYRKQFLKKTYS